MTTTTLSRENLVATAEALLALAHAMEPAQPITFFGVELKPGEGWRTMVELFEAERLRFLTMDAPFGRYPSMAPKEPPSMTEAGQMIDVATREGWPSRHGGAWSKWDYLPGIRQLGVGAPPPVEPRWPLERHLQQFEDDVHALADSPAGQAWLSDIRNAAVTAPSFCRRHIGKAAKRNPDDTLEWVA